MNYGYDNVYRLTSEAVASDPAGNNGTIGYTYDAVGNRTQQTSTNPAISTGGFSYDANDRLTTDSYDANGNTTGSGGLNYSYDFENHLIQQGGATFVYDGDGNRVQKIVAGVTTKYLVATVNPTGYPQVVYETFSGTGITEYWRQFVYGLDRISQYRSTQAGAQKSYYVYDGHGSVRALTDGSGNVTDTYDYDAFGNVTHQTGATPNEFLFASEQYDSNLHLYYNRARYLNTSTGRFWSMDTYGGDPESPLSLHKYLYAQGDPVNNSDPGGMQIDEALGALSLSDTLAAITLTAVCTVSFIAHEGICGGSAGDYERTFYHGTSGYAAEAIVADQGLYPVFFLSGRNTNPDLSDFGAGFYMSEDQDTAKFYAAIRGFNGQNNGPALVIVDIWQSRWKILLSLGAVDSAPVSGLPGQSQAFVPTYLFGLFSLLKTSFSFAPID